MTEQKESKEQIMLAFGKLLAEDKKGESKVATKEEEAEKEKNQQLLAKASEYTVNNIVNGMAALQLDFGNIITELSARLETESSKLDELKRAIAVEQENLKQLQQVRLVADALHILRQEHQERLRSLENHTATEREAIEKDMTQTRKVWEKEQQDFEVRVAETAELLTKQREQELADFQYESARIRKIEMDEYEEVKRQQERELTGANMEKEKAWGEREKYLTDNQAKLAENQQKIAGFDEQLKEEYNKAKGEAIKEAEREAKVKADLFEKEWEATKQGYELKIQSLETTIARQTQQITEINTQLQTATTQAQNLAMRAFSTPTN
ncbi:MAG: hypothetical protein DSM107014_13805 [Gomphosphaeria aponina SAG 52.96 = DSM 107014]|uniref:Uncharacterized protein n=1 Tax=Gomphosphaeria aponina SAG 52.96 = DSM 107014 TaxID=1521640 RepID=A0A941GSE8_9CHRO|nr:hypothetical protein [Gomphosphaeria aponina SAG 52.96 = DSM 107014]